MDEFEVSGYEIIRRTATEHGNGAHVYLPKDWLGTQLALIRTSDMNTNEGVAALTRDPFEGDAVPHLLTVGGIGSGSGYSVSRRALRWGRSKDHRTVVFCSILGGFADIVEAIDGTNILIDDQTINPLGSATQLPRNLSDEAMASFESETRVIEKAGFIANALKSRDVDPDDHRPLIESLLKTAYERKGDDDNDTDESQGSHQDLTVGDFLETAEEMVDDTGSPSNQTGMHIPDHQKELVDELLTTLSVFEEGGKYAQLNGQTSINIEPGSITHLNLKELSSKKEDVDGVGLILQAILTYLNSLVKRSPGETMVVIDEAHFMLNFSSVFDQIERLMRSWRQHDGCLWILTQTPQDVVGNTDTQGLPALANLARSIEFFQTNVTDDDATRFDLTQEQAEFLRSEGATGAANDDYSEGLVRHTSVSGWSHFKQFPSPIEDAVISPDSD